jgi:hypothetical protein
MVGLTLACARLWKRERPTFCFQSRGPSANAGQKTVGARRRLLLRIRRRALLSDFVKRKHFVPEFVETAAEIVIFGLYLKLRIRNVNLFFLSRTKIDPLAAAFGNWHSIIRLAGVPEVHDARHRGFEPATKQIFITLLAFAVLGGR